MIGILAAIGATIATVVTTILSFIGAYIIIVIINKGRDY